MDYISKTCNLKGRQGGGYPPRGMETLKEERRKKEI